MKSTAATPPATAGQPASETIPASVRDFATEIALDLVPLTILPNGQSTMVATGFGNREWTNQDFAHEYLRWVARVYADCAGRKISSNIEVHFLPRFRASTGRIHLAFGSLLRWLAKVTEKEERSYTDWTGLQREMLEYWVPKPRRRT